MDGNSDIIKIKNSKAREHLFCTVAKQSAAIYTLNNINQTQSTQKAKNKIEPRPSEFEYQQEMKNLLTNCTLVNARDEVLGKNKSGLTMDIALRRRTAVCENNQKDRTFVLQAVETYKKLNILYENNLI